MHYLKYPPLIAVALTLAGCGGEQPGQENGAMPTQEAAATVAMLPALRPGLWRTTLIEADMPDAEKEPEDRCVGKGESLIDAFGMQQTAQCSKRTIHKAGNRYIVDASCSNKDVAMTLQANLGGDFANSVDGDLTLGLGLPGQSIPTKRYRYESRYVGACTAGREE